MLAACLGIQIISGVFLAMHYSPNVDLAFASVEHIMRDVSSGWLIRYVHANTASLFFIVVYAHVARGLYYGSFRTPRVLAWIIGVIILILMILTAFLGYVLVYGQMSLWGATVITSMVTAVPWIGGDITTFIWGGFSVGNATLNRFFALHFLFPFILSALAIIHLVALHQHGSGNPLGNGSNAERLPMGSFFLFKDAVTLIALIWFLAYLVMYAPNALGHADNYTPANPLVTPASIVPEWYLLSFYAVLRAIPSKLGGVIAMLAALLILMVLPWTDTGETRGSQFRPLHRALFWVLVGAFVLLLLMGSQHVESPFVEVGQVATLVYFAYFTVAMPLVGLIENTLANAAYYSRQS